MPLPHFYLRSPTLACCQSVHSILCVLSGRAVISKMWINFNWGPFSLRVSGGPLPSSYNIFPYILYLRNQTISYSHLISEEQNWFPVYLWDDLTIMILWRDVSRLTFNNQGSVMETVIRNVYLKSYFCSKWNFLHDISVIEIYGLPLSTFKWLFTRTSIYLYVHTSAGTENEWR